MLSPVGYLHEQCKIVQLVAPILQDTVTTDYVSMKNYSKATVIISGLNTTTVTGNAITILQATTVAGAGAKTLTRVTGPHTVGNIDTAAADALAEITLASNAFTTTAVNSKQYLYVLEIDASELDVDNGFDCFAILFDVTAVATVSDAIALLWPSRYADSIGGPTAITD